MQCHHTEPGDRVVIISARSYTDPFNDVEVDVAFTDECGRETRVPAFWAGDSIWRVRFSSPELGTYTYRTICSDESNPDLHGVEGSFQVTPYTGPNPLYQHGPFASPPTNAISSTPTARRFSGWPIPNGSGSASGSPGRRTSRP